MFWWSAGEKRVLLLIIFLFERYLFPSLNGRGRGEGSLLNIRDLDVADTLTRDLVVRLGWEDEVGH